MPGFDGSGTFDRTHSFTADRDANIPIEASRVDTEFDGMATGLSNCLTKDGQTLPTANIPMNNKRLTGLADATAATDAVNRQTGDGRYSRLSASNVFTGQNEFSTFSATGASDGRRINATTAQMLSSRDSTSNLSHALFYNPNGLVGVINTNGSNTVYNTTSDGELKDAVASANKAAAIAQVKAGRPVEFEFKNERGVKHLGFIAQEMHQVFPDAVTPGDGKTPWMMDHSKLVPLLWAVVQDLLARVEALENA